MLNYLKEILIKRVIMSDLLKLIEKPSLVNFDHLKISIASPEEITPPGEFM